MPASFKSSYALLMVDSPLRSTAFYRDLLGLEPIEKQATFALFALETGLMLGLWSKHTAEPAPGAPAGGVEIGFKVANAAAVDAAYGQWLETRDVRVAQKPIDLDFGRTFVVLDPDGHRLRVFSTPE
ncbi:drug:proton antiporter [Labrys okinawensis]|uniref:Drug:proton antiporter n=1 Tax=Labrys okinawensis TaxID=346911 RepID=A0A2S9QHM9_9HYPH|nr:VOC family protein [Labrys okinawensis]PRH88866.1 drug:proton antiporter [Labrys okinawensis]